MDKYDPEQWSRAYVKTSENECLQILEILNASMKNALSEQDYLTAASCCDKICAGVAEMADGINAEKYLPMLYCYSQMLAEIMLFGIGDDAAIKLALNSLLDAYDFAKECAKPGKPSEYRAKKDLKKIDSFVYDLRMGRELPEIKKAYCPNFPQDIIECI